MTDAVVAKSAEQVNERKAIPANTGVVAIDGLPQVTRTAPHDGLSFPFDTVTNREFLMVYVREHYDGSRTVGYDVAGNVYNQSPEHLWDRYQHHGWRQLHIVSDAPALPGGWPHFSNYFSPFLESPWARKEVFINNLERWIESFPVPSKKVPGLVAYFQDTDKRARDIQTPIKPGKYLKKFFGDLLSEEEIHEMALEWSNQYAARKLNVTQDADEIERIYRGKYNGSCMHFGSGGFAGPEHPARVYAGPDLGIAFIGDMDNADGRCLVWPSKKMFYPKFYGDSHRMEAALIAAGWRAGDEDDFDGARLQRIPYSGGFVLPYLDTSDNVTDDGKWLVVDQRGDIGARNTNGLSDEVEVCDDCEDACDDRTYIGSVDRHVCEHCRDSNYFYCDEMDDYYPDDERVPVHSDTHYALSQRGADYGVNRGRLFFCELSDAYYSCRDYEQVELTDGRTAEAGKAELNGYFCEFSEQWSVDFDARQELSDGRYIDMDMVGSPSELDAWLEGEGVTLVGAIKDDNQIELDLAA